MMERRNVIAGLKLLRDQKYKFLAQSLRDQSVGTSYYGGHRADLPLAGMLTASKSYINTLSSLNDELAEIVAQIDTLTSESPS